MKTRVTSAMLALLIAAPAYAFADSESATRSFAELFSMRGDTPYSAVLGYAGAPVANGRLGVDLRVSSHATLQSHDDEAVLLDGESHRLTFYARHRLSRRVVLGAELPYIRHTGGFMDGFIDKWHQTFGLREGIRPVRPGDQLEYRYQSGSDLSAPITDSTSGLGDLLLTADLALGRQDTSRTDRQSAGIRWTARLGAELPTGEERRLTGSGHTDLSLALRASGRAGASWHWQAGAGIAFPGGSPESLLPAENRFFYYDVALMRDIGQSLRLIVQAGGHTAPYESGLDALGKPAMLLAMGIAWQPTRAYAWRIGFVEDLKAGTAADFALELGFTWQPGANQ